MLAWLSRRVVKDAWYVVGTWAVVALVLLSVLLTGLGGKGVLEAFGRTTSTVAGTESAEGEEVLAPPRRVEPAVPEGRGRVSRGERGPESSQ